ncbi:uncharacterized protein B0J16DRAFT_385555 [Fusarium flagelliforme]|uniref:Uncharacterized protein n=1 Tax=Fusarium flagelliforme TaxID=2675880 RepID=A0A395MRG1_9HYPO|nr:uncharacterized protein B0J16DRAFT_385555 [Fusarium flagelliforme]KAH7182482.1 hypothetical protein B0J16DRAFT_385555 [Fusarium flagelliforme]RFN50544.1 hypothetical protein FIE12Z_5170 [Fusarium flagelliforme]
MAPLPAGRDKIPAYDTLFGRDTFPDNPEYNTQDEKTYHEGPEVLSACKRGLIQRSHESFSSWAYNELRGPYDNRPPPPGQPPDYWKHHRPAPLYTPDYPPTRPPARQPPSSYNPGYPEQPAYGRDYLPPRPAPHYDPGYDHDYPPRPAPPYDPSYPPAQKLPAVHDPQVDQIPGHVAPKPAAPSLAEKVDGVDNMAYIGGVVGAVLVICGGVIVFKKWREKRQDKKEAEGAGGAGGDGGDDK